MISEKESDFNQKVSDNQKEFSDNKLQNRNNDNYNLTICEALTVFN